MVKELKNIVNKTMNQINRNKINNKIKNETLSIELFNYNNKKTHSKMTFNKSKYYLYDKLYINNILLNIMLIIILYPLCFCDKLKLNKIIEIEITVKGKGNQNILSKDYNELPNEIIVNGSVYNNYNGRIVYNLTSEESNIIMKWNTSITNCSSMFSGLSNIAIIKFLNFNNSSINNMSFMFRGCTSLLSIYFINFDTSSVTDMGSMFYDCINLKYLDLNSFDTSSVININNMFYNCSSLLSLNLSNFNISSIKYMDSLFNGCINLTSLNLDNFNTSSVIYMSKIFYNCKSLFFLNLNHFNTSSVKYMDYIFYGCSSLLSLNINNFDTSSVTNMNSMFYGCKSLISLNINNFNTSSVRDMSKMFYDCISLVSLNINNFNTLIVSDMSKMFYDCISLISLNINNFNTSSVSDMSKMFYLCISLKSLNINNFDTSSVTSMNSMFYGCSSLISLNINNFNTLSVTDISKMFYDCSSLKSLNINNFDTSSVTNMNSMFYGCSNNLAYCINETKASKITSLLLNFTSNCSYIDNNNLKPTYNDSPSYINNSFNNENLSKDENISNIPNINIKIDELFINCNLNELFNGECKINNIYDKDDIINHIKDKIINDSTNSLMSNVIGGDKKDLIIKDNNTLYQITTSDNQNNNQYNNISSIILGKCEDVLKSKYNLINKDLPLLIFKIDYFQPGSLIPIIGYEVYHPITKEKLDLTLCKDDLINYNIPVSIDENNLVKYDPESQYYKDECYPSTTDNGTDILINDRQNEYNDNNMSICENNCTIKEYNNETKKVNCECEIKSKELVISDIINQTDILSHNFTSKNESFNMVTMKCYYTLFTKEGLYKNIVSYILIITILILLISSILFYKCGYHLLEDDIQEIINLKEINNKKRKNKESIIEKTNIINDKKIIVFKKTKKKKIKKKIKIIQKSNDDKKKKMKLNNNNSKSLSKLIINNKNKNVYNKREICKNLISNKNFGDSEFYSDYEINTFSYYDALKYDKRNYFKYYFSLIKIKQPLLFSFYPIKDYNLLIIKIDLFFLSFSIYYFINNLFFDEKTIHKIYEDEGIYNFIYLIPHIIYSFIISHTLVIIIKYFSLSEKNICEIKKENSFKIANDKISNVKRYIIIKYICFFCLSIFFLLFFWYYLSSFSAVYTNTQIYLFKNILISFGLSLIYPFIINLIPSFLRIYALKSNDRKCIFILSKIIQFL